MKQTDEKGNPLTYWGGLEEQTKCYCGHTNYCDCGPEEEPNQDETEHLLSTETNKNRLLKDIKQTAVEWLLENSHIVPKNELNKRKLIEQAKEMEKQQINLNKCYHPLTERKHTSDTHFECTICGYNNY